MHKKFGNKKKKKMELKFLDIINNNFFPSDLH